MEEKLKEKLNRISNIWNYYIWKYKFCNSKIKFTDDVKSNYFGDILKYFYDTFEVIYREDNSESFSDNFERTLAFLQSIYIQQDFIEELLLIFKCGISKGDLKLDSNYSLNRDIRNELVGHPIRKEIVNGKEVLLSSTIFTYRSFSLDSNDIIYAKYHKDNNYQGERIKVSKTLIITRHEDFLDKYFEAILNNLYKILRKFKKRIEELELVLLNHPLEKTISFAESSFESIFDEDYLYKQDYLSRLLKKQSEHERYKNGILMFQKELKESLLEKKQDIDDYLEEKEQKVVTSSDNYVVPRIEFVEIDSNFKDEINEQRTVTYHYELSKLLTKRTPPEFDFFSSLLKDKCKDNLVVLEELDHMKNHLSNDFEYFSSHLLLSSILMN